MTRYKNNRTLPKMENSLLENGKYYSIHKSGFKDPYSH